MQSDCGSTKVQLFSKGDKRAQRVDTQTHAGMLSPGKRMSRGPRPLLMVCGRLLDYPVCLENVHSFVNREGLDGVAVAGDCRCFEHRVVDRFFGCLDHSFK